VSAVSLALTLLCGAVLAVGVMHWVHRPPQGAFDAGLARSAVAFAAPQIEARSPAEPQELPRTLPEARVPSRADSKENAPR
jgi:hypothetical protein